MSDTTFYVALDADDEPCVWRRRGDLDIVVLRRCDLSMAYRSDAWDVLTGHLAVFA